MKVKYRSESRPLVPHLELSIGPIASGDRLTPTLGVYYPLHTMLGASKRVDFELTFAPSALEKLARVNAEVDLERAHVVLPDGKRYPFFPTGGTTHGKGMRGFGIRTIAAIVVGWAFVTLPSGV